MPSEKLVPITRASLGISSSRRCVSCRRVLDACDRVGQLVGGLLRGTARNVGGVL